uniref:Uncharacterized protein n=1 Tax=Callorhinchus milii TaxID=7868 RepID=A0A4W3GZ07_CALMI
MPQSPVSSEDERRSLPEYPGESDTDSSRDETMLGDAVASSALSKPKDKNPEADFSMMVFRIGIPDLQQTVSARPVVRVRVRCARVCVCVRARSLAHRLARSLADSLTPSLTHSLTD